MSKENCTDPMGVTIIGGFEYHHGWIFTQKILASVEGNQMAIIEAMGLPEKQEQAIKSQLKQALYRQTRTALFVGSQEVAEIGNERGDKFLGEHPIAHSSVETND